MDVEQHQKQRQRQQLLQQLGLNTWVLEGVVGGGGRVSGSDNQLGTHFCINIMTFVNDQLSKREASGRT